MTPNNRDALELAPYLDEPPQLASGSTGKNGRLALRYERRDDRSILASSERNAPLLVQKALYCDEGMPGLPVVFIISNSGGILQGDRYHIRVEVGPHACGHLTTQAATKIHEMDANYAAQTQEIVLEEGSYFEFIPDQVIPFRHSRFLTRTNIQIDPTATLFYAETLVGGRKFYQEGEMFQFDLFSSTVKAERLDGSELFVEKFLIEPFAQSVHQLGVMQDFDVFGNVLLLTPQKVMDTLMPQLVPDYNTKTMLASGGSRLPNNAGILFKVLGNSTEAVIKRIREFWGLARLAVTGFQVPPPFPWR